MYSCRRLLNCFDCVARVCCLLYSYFRKGLRDARARALWVEMRSRENISQELNCCLYTKTAQICARPILYMFWQLINMHNLIELYILRMCTFKINLFQKFSLSLLSLSLYIQINFSKNIIFFSFHNMILF